MVIFDFGNLCDTTHKNFGGKPTKHTLKFEAKYWVDKMTVDETRVNKLGCYCSFPPLTVSSVPWYTGHHPFILFFLKRSTGFTSFSSSLAGFGCIARQQQRALLAGFRFSSWSEEWEELLLASSGSSSISRKETWLAGSGIAWRLRSSVPEVRGREEH